MCNDGVLSSSMLKGGDGSGVAVGVVGVVGAVGAWC